MNLINTMNLLRRI